jgi:uncharacterized membrane-anchored protein YitT (DUF2179 family)
MKKYTSLLISLFIAALNFNIILKPLNLVTGGNQGIAIILKHILKLKPSTIIFFINIIALIISYIFLRKDTTISLVISSIIYPLFIKLTSFISIQLITKSLIVSSILAGIICGITGGIIYKHNFNQGGISIINTLLHTYLKVKIPITNFIINTSIMLMGTFYFGIKKLIYSLLVILISNLIINHIMSKNNLTKNLN